MRLSQWLSSFHRSLVEANPLRQLKPSPQKEKRMFIKRIILWAAGVSLAATVSLAAPRLGAQTPSESERLQKLERAVEQLQKRNTELEQEVSSAKKQAASTAEVGARMKTKNMSDGKSNVEKAAE